MKKITFVLLILLSGFSLSAQSVKLQRALNKLNQALYLIDVLYVDTVNISKITEQALISAVAELDPHSSYISAEDVKAMNEPLVGNFEGIGIEFAIIKDTLTVQATIAGGPSEKVGLRAGDKILKVAGENVAGIGLTNNKVYDFLRGSKGTKAELEILRRGVSEPLHFSVVRDKIPINSVDAAYEPEDGILYIKLSRFAAPSHSEIVEAFSKASKPLKGVIMDLRSNSGGYLPTAISIANEFLQAGDLIVYTDGRAMPRMQENADGSGLYTRGPLVVMIDENSASASEILAGAIQDQDRGIIVGRRSFGKGLVQNAIPLDDGSELRLTVARYHTPSGRVIQSPYQEGNSEQYYKDFYERFLRGESFAKDSIHMPDSLKYRTLKQGRIVYGGGGIIPDVFVPTDTLSYTDYYASLLRQGVVIEYVNSECDRNREQWKRAYPSFNEFETKFVVSSELMDGLVALAEEKGIKPAPEQLEKSRIEIENYMKALIASSLYNRGAFYRVLNDSSPEFDAAMEALKSMM